MAGKGEGWEKLRKSIRAELDEAQLEKFHGTVSLPFAAGDNRKIAVKIVDDRGIESLKVIPLPGVMLDEQAEFPDHQLAVHAADASQAALG